MWFWGLGKQGEGFPYYVNIRLNAILFWKLKLNQVDKNQPCYIIKMREMRGEVGKKPLKKEIDNPLFLWRHMAEFLRHFVQLQVEQ